MPVLIPKADEHICNHAAQNLVDTPAEAQPAPSLGEGKKEVYIFESMRSFFLSKKTLKKKSPFSLTSFLAHPLCTSTEAAAPLLPPFPSLLLGSGIAAAVPEHEDQHKVMLYHNDIRAYFREIEVRGGLSVAPKRMMTCQANILVEKKNNLILF